MSSPSTRRYLYDPDFVLASRRHGRITTPTRFSLPHTARDDSDDDLEAVSWQQVRFVIDGLRGDISLFSSRRVSFQDVRGIDGLRRHLPLFVSRRLDADVSDTEDFWNIMHDVSTTSCKDSDVRSFTDASDSGRESIANGSVSSEVSKCTDDSDSDRKPMASGSASSAKKEANATGSVVTSVQSASCEAVVQSRDKPENTSIATELRKSTRIWL